MSDFLKAHVTPTTARSVLGHTATSVIGFAQKQNPHIYEVFLSSRVWKVKSLGDGGDIHLIKIKKLQKRRRRVH